MRSGPAEVKNNVLYFTGTPLRAKFPVKVTIVAYQYGTKAEPAYKSAKPVERTFYLTKK